MAVSLSRKPGNLEINKMDMQQSTNDEPSTALIVIKR